MSEQNGTESPWAADAAAVLFHGRRLFTVGAECGLPMQQRRTIASRIVDCLNACEGVDTSALTPGRLAEEIVKAGKHLVVREGSGV